MLQDSFEKRLKELESIKNEEAWDAFKETEWKRLNWEVNKAELDVHFNGKREYSVTYDNANDPDDIRTEQYSFDEYNQMRMGGTVKSLNRDIRAYFSKFKKESNLNTVKENYYDRLTDFITFGLQRLKWAHCYDAIADLNDVLSLSPLPNMGILSGFHRQNIRSMVTGLVELGYVPNEKDRFGEYPNTQLVAFLKDGISPIKPFQSGFSIRAFNTFYTYINKAVEARTSSTIRQTKSFDQILKLNNGTVPSQKSDRNQLKEGSKRNQLLAQMSKLTA